MKTFTFTTNINCGGCIATVTPFMEKAAGILEWKVDIADPKKPLTVKTESLSADEIISIVKSAGFEIKEKKKRFLF
jgi:copper chaperone CopZ